MARAADEILSFPTEEEARERALERFGIDIEGSLRAWFEEMGLSAEYVAELMARTPRVVELGPGRHNRRSEDYMLTERQRDVLSYTACGFTRPEIQGFMRITTWTLKDHVDKARSRLKATTIGQAVLIAALLGELSREIIEEHLMRHWDA